MIFIIVAFLESSVYIKLSIKCLVFTFKFKLDPNYSGFTTTYMSDWQDSKISNALF